MFSTVEYPCAPPEVWSLILLSLRPNCLAQVALVSSSFRSLALPILYRAVRLRSDSEAVRSTFALLKSTYSLRENLRDLHISSPWKNFGEHPDIFLDLDILAFLPGLRVLTLAGLPYYTAKENIEFAIALSCSCSLLEELIVLEDPSVYCVPDEDGDSEWPVSHPLYFAEIFVKCRMSLTRLEMVLLSVGENIISSLPFSMSHFPNLTSLELGPCLDYPNDEGGRVLTQFLVDHPLLEQLSLDFSAENTIMVELCERTITSDMLPRLRSLRASVGTVLRLARNEVRSLQTHLFKLHLRYDQTMLHEAVAMLSVLEDFGGLPVLDELCYEVDVQHDLDEHILCKDAMLRTGKICPALRRLTVPISLIEVEDVMGIFPYFPNITHLNCPLLRGTEETHDIAVCELASMCNKLVEVSFGLDGSSHMQFCLVNGSVLRASVIPGPLGF